MHPEYEHEVFEHKDWLERDVQGEPLSIDVVTSRNTQSNDCSMYLSIKGRGRLLEYYLLTYNPGTRAARAEGECIDGRERLPYLVGTLKTHFDRTPACRDFGPVLAAVARLYHTTNTSLQ